jgi:ribosome maturation factor RimP
VTLDVEGTARQLPYADISNALVQVELNRKPRPAQPEKEN